MDPLDIGGHPIGNAKNNVLLGDQFNVGHCDIPSALHSWIVDSVTSKKLPNVYKICPKMISLEKLKILTPLQKLQKNVGDLGKIIVAKGLEKLPKVQ